MICVGLSDILYSGALGKLVYRVHTLIAICTRDHVTFNANDVYVDNIYRPIHTIVVVPTCDSMKILTSNIVI